MASFRQRAPDLHSDRRHAARRSSRSACASVPLADAVDSRRRCAARCTRALVEHDVRRARVQRPCGGARPTARLAVPRAAHRAAAVKTTPIAPARIVPRRRRYAAIGRVRRRLPPATRCARAGTARLSRRRRAACALARSRTLRRPRDRLRPRQQLSSRPGRPGATTRSAAAISTSSRSKRAPPTAAPTSPRSQRDPTLAPLAAQLAGGVAAVDLQPASHRLRRRPRRAAARLRRCRRLVAADRRSPSTRSSSTASRRRAIRRCGSARLFKAMARLAAPKATVATWTRGARRARRPAQRPASRSSARPAAAASATSRAPASRHASRRAPVPRRLPSPARRPKRDAVIIVGAGLAGCALARALAERGRSSLILERGRRHRQRGLGQRRRVVPWRRPSRRRPPCALPSRRRLRGERPRSGSRSRAHGVDGSVAGLLRLEDEARSVAHRCRPSLDRARPARRLRARARRRRGEPIWPARRSPPARGTIPVAAGSIRAASRGRGSRAPEAASICDCDPTRQPCGAAPTDAGSCSTRPAPSSPQRATVVLANAGGAAALLGAADWPIERQRGQISAIAGRALARGEPAAPADRRLRLRRCRRSTARSGSAPRRKRGRRRSGAARAEDHRANLDAPAHALSADRPDLDPGQLLGPSSALA